VRDSEFRARRAGLLVVDLQRFFLDPESPAYMPAAGRAARAARSLVEAFRRAGRPVLFSVHAHGEPQRERGLMRDWWDEVCLAGSPWARVAAVLEPRQADVYPKTGYSAFSNPGLERRLRAEGVAQLVLAGVKTDLCVESTARAAFDLGWLTFVAADATAARTEAQQVAALRAMARGFSVVTRVEGLVDKLAIETRKS
jgi:bifunctional isochorismate lyase/aryl carrier protein